MSSEFVSRKTDHGGSPLVRRAVSQSFFAKRWLPHKTAQLVYSQADKKSSILEVNNWVKPNNIFVCFLRQSIENEISCYTSKIMVLKPHYHRLNDHVLQVYHS